MKVLSYILTLLIPVFCCGQAVTGQKKALAKPTARSISCEALGIHPNTGTNVSSQISKAASSAAALGFQKIIFPKGYYTFTDSAIISNVDGLEFAGEGTGTVFYSNTKQRVLIFTDCSNIYLHDLDIETRLSDTIDRGYGMLYFYVGSAYNSHDNHIERVNFKCPNAKTNAMLWVVDHVAGSFSDCWVRKCSGDSIGRMWFEMINHINAATYRYWNIDVSENTVRHCGSVRSGIANAFISFGGRSRDCFVTNNKLFDPFETPGVPINVGIENGGCERASITDNQMYSATNGFIGILLSNARKDSVKTWYNNISGNKIYSHSVLDSTSAIGLLAKNMSFSMVTDNLFQTDNYGLFLYGVCHDNYFSGTYKLNHTTLGNAVYLNDTVTNNVFSGKFDGSLQNKANGYVVVCFGTHVTRNNFTGSTLHYRAGGKGIIFNTNGSAGNALTRNVQKKTYKPTISGRSNITSVSQDEFKYSRIGNQVTVSGHLTVKPLKTNNIIKFCLSLPIDPGANFPDTFKAVGGAGLPTPGHTQYCQVISNPGTKTVYCTYYSRPSSTAIGKLTLNFMYYVEN